MREGVQYEITVQGETMNPMAHVAAHAAVKEQIEEDPLVRTAFENMVATTTSDIITPNMVLLRCSWRRSRRAPGPSKCEKIQKEHGRSTYANVKNSVPIRPFAKNLPDSSRPIIPRLNGLDFPPQPLERRTSRYSSSQCASCPHSDNPV